jgi:polysaccharide export outer membrane protein
MITPRAVRWIACLALLASAAGPLGAQRVELFVTPGDRILLQVTGEPQLSDTFTVLPGPAIDLPTLGRVPLAGVPRDSVQPHLATFLARYLREPQVRAVVLLRLGVSGEVVRPGFYALPSTAVLEDLIMAAGGMTQDARLEKATLMRDADVVLRPDEVRRSIAGAETLAAIGIHSGDALQIPRRPDQEGRVRTIGGLLAIPLTVIALVSLL